MNFLNKKLITIGLVVFVSFLLLFFLFRNNLLNYFLERKLAGYEERYSTKVTIKEADFKGLTGLLFKGIVVAESNKDTLLKIDSVFFNLRLFPLLVGKIRFSNLMIANTKLHIVKTTRENNLSFLLTRKKSITTDTLKVESNYGMMASNFLSSIFEAIPNKVSFTKSTIWVETDSLSLRAIVPKLRIDEQRFITQVQFIENQDSSIWFASGEVYSAEQRAQIKIYPAEKSKLEIPFLKQKYKLALSFDTLLMTLAEVDYVANELKVKGKLAASNFGISHWRISPNKIVIKNQEMDMDLRVGTNYFMLDSASKVTYNKVSYHPFIRFQSNPAQQLQIKIDLPDCSAQDFFDSFPEGLFENIDGIKAGGNLYYRLHFFIDTKHPDALQFSSYLGRKNFKVLGYGKSVLTKINGEFQYTAYEKGKAVRTFSLGTNNPNYTPIEQISVNLKSALLTSEDGNFYSHSGFNEDAFRKSIATNFKEKRFVRGGSTISMQLVKNVFLTRNKTVARKVEEALLVWLIENNRLSSKERMYEVYLNLIEWGPNVYGIGEASRFYFDKSPNDLTLSESIFLSMIVPRPKGFKYYFDKNGQLKESTFGYFNLVAGHMVKKGIISEEQKSALVPNVELKGPAKALVQVTDTVEAPLELEEDEE